MSVTDLGYSSKGIYPCCEMATNDGRLPRPRTEEFGGMCGRPGLVLAKIYLYLSGMLRYTGLVSSLRPWVINSNFVVARPLGSTLEFL